MFPKTMFATIFINLILVASNSEINGQKLEQYLHKLFQIISIVIAPCPRFWGDCGGLFLIEKKQYLHKCQFLKR